MARRKKGNRINGWLILDKPLHMTSTQAVGKIRWLFQAQKAGHAGTLDPLATGILPIALGEATKTVSFTVDGEKAYRFTVRWGIETSTDDAEGPSVRTSDRRPSRAEVEALLPAFTGEIMQTPPAFSAIKIDGHRAYDLARDGEDVILEPRPVFIDTLRIMDHSSEGETVLEATCGKGTYVRAIARDMGRQLGCYGHVIALRRTRVGPFDESHAITLDELEKLAALDDGGVELSRCLNPIETALAGMVELSVTSSDAGRLRLGQPVLIRGRDAPIMKGEIYAVCKGQLVAMGEIERGEMRPTRVFNLD